MTDVVANISAADWSKGIALSVLASLVGGASKLVIRKSWLMVVESDDEVDDNEDRDDPGPENDNDGEMPPPQTLTLDTVSVTSSEENYPVYTEGEDSRFARRWKWWIPPALRYTGMLGMSVLNPVCCVLAMNYASPSILAPLSGLTLVWVILLSQSVVGEKPSNAQVTACCLIIAGEVIVAIFGDHTNDVDMTAAEVRQSYKDPYFLSYFAGLGVYVTTLIYLINCTECPMLRRFAWGSCGGSITGMQNFLKDSLTLFNSVGAKDPWILPFFFSMAAASAFFGLLMLTACMKRYDATYSAASFVGSFVVSASIMSAVHYHTFQSLDHLMNLIMYPLGLLVLIVGVYILVRESHEPDEILLEDIEGIVPVRKNSSDSQTPFMYTQVEDDGEAENEENLTV